MIRIKHYFLFLISMIIYSVSFSQDDVIILDQAETGATHTHVAREKIIFKPGYEYAAQQDAHVQAYIDMWLPADLNYSDLFTNGTLPREIDTSLPVELTSGTHGISSSGGATYSFPIEVLPGISGVQPQISLSYNSQSGNGIVGHGWGLSGVSAIQRTGKNIYYDGEKTSISLSESDRYVLDGQRLMKEGGSYGNAGIYQTEMENFSQITAYQAPATSSSSYFKVETKEGMTAWYGYDDTSNEHVSNSKVMDANGSRVVAWNISKMMDRNGNYMLYEYDNSDGENRIRCIKYTGNDSAGRETFQSITFHYGIRTDENELFQAETSFKQRYLLKQIKLRHHGIVKKTYSLEYGLDHYSFLKEIHETDLEGNKLNSVRFRYDDFSPALSTENIYHFDEGGHVRFLSGDYNGDGISDMMVLHKATSSSQTFDRFSLYLREDDSFRKSSTGILPSGVYGQVAYNHHVNVADFNGDGITDFAVNSISNQNSEYSLDHTRVYFSKGAEEGFDHVTYYPVSTANKINENHISNSVFSKVGDFDGDGRTDFLNVLHHAGGYRVYMTRPTVNNIAIEVSGIYIPETESDDIELLVMDHDGDGKSELMIVPQTPATANTIIYTFENFSSSSIDSRTMHSSGFPSVWHTYFAGDFNGDGKTDLLNTGGSPYSDNNWLISYSTGNGFISSSFVFSSNPGLTDDGIDSRSINIGDFNGDGKSDIIHAIPRSTRESGTTSVFNMYMSSGKGFKAYTEHFNGDMSSRDQALVQGDFNGDGKLELVDRKGLNFAEIHHFFKNKNVGKLREVLNGFNGKTEFEYKWISQDPDYEKETGSLFPVVDFEGAMSVVDRISSSNGIDGTNTTRYNFDEARVHLQGKGFLGFNTITETNETSNIEVKTTVQLSDPTYYSPLISNTTVKSVFNPLSPKLLSNSYAEYEIIDDGSYSSQNRYWYRAKKVSRNDLRTGVNTQEEFQEYDSDGNIVRKKTSLGGQVVTLEKSYSNFVSNGSWLPYLPETIEVKTTSSGEIPYIRKTNFTYDANGNVKTNESDPLSDRPVTSTYGYNWLGLVASERTSSPATNDYEALPEISIVTIYDDYGYLTKRTSTGGDFNEFEYDPITGNLLTKKGVTGLSTNYHYDDLGRVSQTTDPLGRTTYFNYNWDIGSSSSSNTSVGNSIFYTSTYGDGKAESRKWFDRLGRSRKVETDGFNGQVIQMVISYDELGRVSTETSPFYEGESYNAVITTHEYHPEHGMVESSSNSIGTVSKSYDLSAGLFAATTTSMAGVTTTSYHDAAGRHTKTVDDGGTVEYSYFSNGEPKEVRVNGTVTSTMEYDGFGHQTKLVGINAGVAEYKYNAYGQLFWQKNANDNVTEFFYDGKGRIDYEETPDGMIDYEYETSINGKNKLKKVIGINGAVTMEYIHDQYSRIIEEKENLLTENKEMITSYSYDYLGRIENTTYPSGVMTTNSYVEPDGIDKGLLTLVSMQGQSEPIYKINAVNALGQVTMYTNGNGVVTTNNIDKYGLLKHQQVSGVVDMEYDYELTTGNMSFRQDNISGLKEVFEYDNLDRLTESKIIDITDESLVLNLQTQSYFDNGNIEVKSDVGTYKYNAQKINAVSKLEDVVSDFDYDQRDITYTYFDKIETILESGIQLALSYGPSQSKKKVESRDESNNLIYSRFYGYQFEEFYTESSGTTTEITYLPGGAVHVQNDNDIDTDDGLYYLYGDHQGSIIACTDKDGNITGKQSYDAWGRTRNPISWDQSENTQPMPEWLARGYTGHEHYAAYDLINMNGRTYDPRLARMIQVDNFIQAPGFTQSHNRYSYVLNNPLKYTDPSGEIIFTIIGALLAPVTGGASLALGIAMDVGGGINLGVKAYQGQINSVGDGLAAYGIGAAAGAVGYATGGAAFAAYGGGAAGAGGIAAGFASGAASSAAALPVLSMGNTIAFNDPLMTIDQYIIGIAAGGVLGAIVNGGIAYANNKNVHLGDPVADGRTRFSFNNTDKNVGSNPTGSGRQAVVEVDDIFVPSDQPENGLSQGYIQDQQGRIASTNYTEDVALGVREHLDDFAESVSASTWKKWAAVDFEGQFLGKVRSSSTKIHFNLDGIDNPWSAIQQGSRGYLQGGYTNWELFQIYSDPNIMSRTIFYSGGSVVPSPF